VHPKLFVIVKVTGYTVIAETAAYTLYGFVAELVPGTPKFHKEVHPPLTGILVLVNCTAASTEQVVSFVKVKLAVGSVSKVTVVEV
jgi:hypothetical protein